MKESSNNPLAENSLHYLGLYQIGESALIDAGYYEKVPGAGRWEGSWTGKNGINSKEDFLNNRQVQEIAIREYHERVWQYLKHYQDNEGSVINDITLSKAGMIAYSHLVGVESLEKFINSEGEDDPIDANGVKGSDYLDAFAEHLDVDWSVPEYVPELAAEDFLKQLIELILAIFTNKKIA